MYSNDLFFPPPTEANFQRLINLGIISSQKKGMGFLSMKHHEILRELCHMEDDEFVILNPKMYHQRNLEFFWNKNFTPAELVRKKKKKSIFIWVKCWSVESVEGRFIAHVSQRKKGILNEASVWTVPSDLLTFKAEVMRTFIDFIICQCGLWFLWSIKISH